MSFRFEDGRVVSHVNAVNACAAADLGSAMARVVGPGNVVVTGRDGKGFSRLMKRAMTCGIMENGIEILDTRMVPAPVARYTIINTSSDYGAYLGFHWRNPGSLSAVFFDETGALLGEDLVKRIVENLGCCDRLASAREVGDIVYFAQAIPAYLAELQESMDAEAVSRACPKILLDCANGAVSVTLPGMLRQLGCDVVAAHDNPTVYLTKRPTMADDSLLAELAARVRVEGADLGVALDPCGESARFIDDRGQVVSEAELGLMLVQHSHIRRIGIHRGLMEAEERFSSSGAQVALLGEEDQRILPPDIDVGLGEDHSCYLGDANRRWWDAAPMVLKLVDLISRGHQISELRRDVA